MTPEEKAVIDAAIKLLQGIVINEWRTGDPEPKEVTNVIDYEGDRWNRTKGGWWQMVDCGIFGFNRPWEELLTTRGPLRLPEDAE